MTSFLDRSNKLIGEENVKKLASSHVAVFGLGGVGGFIVEALVRSGIGELTLIDNDCISPSNINRQIISLSSNLGSYKTEEAKKRALEINKNIKVHIINSFLLPENSNEIDFSSFDYVADAVDTVTAKIEIIKKCKENDVKVISCMGTGGKLSPEQLKIDDISKTSYCPLAKVIRRELNKRDIKDVLVVYSTEKAVKNEETDGEKNIPSMIFVPASAGILMASQIVKDLIK